MVYTGSRSMSLMYVPLYTDISPFPIKPLTRRQCIKESSETRFEFERKQLP